MRSWGAESFLCIETSTRVASLGLVTAEGKCLMAEEFDAGRELGTRLFARLHEFMHRIRESEDAGGLAVLVGRGPGSYSGLRIGMAAAIGLARGLGARVVAAPSIAAIPGAEGTIGVVGGAGRGMEYETVVRRCVWHAEVRLAPASESMDMATRLKREVGLVIAADKRADFAGVEVRRPVAWRLFDVLRAFDLDAPPHPLEPIYLQGPVALAPAEPDGRVE